MIPMKAHSNPCHKIDTAAPYRSVDIILWRSHEDAYHWNFLDWFNKMYLEMKGHILYVLAWFIFVEFIWYSLGYFSSTTRKECKLKFEFLYISSDEIRESKDAIKKKWNLDLSLLTPSIRRRSSFQNGEGKFLKETCFKFPNSVLSF